MESPAHYFANPGGYSIAGNTLDTPAFDLLQAAARLVLPSILNRWINWLEQFKGETIHKNRNLFTG